MRRIASNWLDGTNRSAIVVSYEPLICRDSNNQFDYRAPLVAITCDLRLGMKELVPTYESFHKCLHGLAGSPRRHEGKKLLAKIFLRDFVVR